MSATMQRIGEVMSARGPDMDEASTRDYVYELAHAWMRGKIDLAGVRSASTGKDRFTAVRFSSPGEEKDTLMLLIDALIAQDESEFDSDHGRIKRDILHIHQYVKTKQHDGRWAWTSPLHTMHGIPVYPNAALPPGEEKRADTEAKERTYREYMRTKREDRR